MDRFLARLVAAGALLAVLAAGPAAAQSVVTGTVVDAESAEPLPGASVMAVRLGPDSLRTGVASGPDGTFRLTVGDGSYRLRVSFTGYDPLERTVTVAGEPVALGRLALAPDVGALGEAVIEAVQERVAVRGDTTAFNAAAYQTPPDASAADLVAKMPGVVVQDGEVQAQGERVTRVLVDGEEFFGTDPMAALRNLPAEVIREVQVYDRQSDQARFTGFEDGEEERTINIVTRTDRRNGQFGRLFGGLGTDTRYLTGGTVNIFDGSRRISVVGLSNNVNQQNFATEDLAGVADGGGGGRRGGGGRGSRGGGSRGGGDVGAYLVGEQDGINTTSSLGVNYSDRWGGAVRVTGSYFVNLAGNDTDASLEREYFQAGVANQLYGEATTAESSSANHRLSLRLEADLSDATQLTVRPRLSVQDNAAERVLSGLSGVAGGPLLSQTRNATTSDALALTSNTDVLLRHRFATRGRTLSANVGLALDGRRSDSAQDVASAFFEPGGGAADSTIAFERRIDSDGGGRQLSARLSYTEPVGPRVQLQLSYSPSVSTDASDQGAFRRDPGTGTFTVLDSTFTSVSDQRVVRQRGGVDLQVRTERVRASAGLDVQGEWLAYEQGGPRPFAVDRAAVSLLPSARLNVELAESKSLNVSYRASTDVPNVTQLRDVVDDTNPLLVTTGSPDLQTSASHRVDLRYRATDPRGGSVLMGFASVTATRDYIGTSTVVAGADGPVVRGVELQPGAQLSFPVNLDGYFSARSFATYGRPVPSLKSNVNANLGVTYTQTPSLLNATRNRARSVGVDGRLFVGSNVSERVDFTLSYGLGYATVSNTTAAARDGDYLRHRGGLRVTLLPRGGLSFQSDLDLSYYTGLSDTVDPLTALWTVGVGYKFMQADRAELRLTVADLLNQNASVGRTVTGTYVEDREAQGLGRYVMLNLVYQLRQFGR